MSIEFEGGPIDGVKKHNDAGAHSEIWLIGRKAPFAVYIRKEKSGGVAFQFDRYCTGQEAEELKAKYKTEQASGLSPGQGY